MVSSRTIAPSDIAIIGGGPAATIFGIILARDGAQVRLIRKSQGNIAPRELVSGRGRRRIEEILNKSLCDLANAIEIDETVSLWDSSEPEAWSSLNNPWGAGVAVNRMTFDQSLCNIAQEEGVEIISDTTVLDVKRKGGLWQLTLQQGRFRKQSQCSFVVLGVGRAPGVHLILQKPQGQALNTVLMSYLKTNNTISEHTLYLEATERGWWYSLPDSRNTRFVAYCTSAGAVERRRISVYDFFFDELRRSRLITNLFHESSECLQLFGRSVGVNNHDKVSGVGWVAIGDAAFAPDPLSGVGIEFAVESALAAAHELRGITELGPLVEYEKWVNEYSLNHNKILAHYLNAIGDHKAFEIVV